MTRTEHERAARRRGELARDHASRKVFSAIDAQRRLNARSASGTRTKTVPIGPSDPRYAYLTRTHDHPPLVRLARDENGIHPSHEDDDTSESGTDARITVAGFLVGK